MLGARWGGGALVALLTLALTAGPAAGQELRALTLSADNDGFDFWLSPHDRTDWYYTHGLRFEAVLAWNAMDLGFLDFDDLPPCGDGSPDAPCAVTHVALGQKIYTPRDVFFYRPDSSDRPYAGWLYASLATQRVSPGAIRTYSLTAGVTGRPALGQWAHRGFHRWLDKYPPQGWEYQIPFEIAVAASYEESRHYALAGNRNAFSATLEPRWTGTLGTLRTSADYGMALRTGWNAAPGVAWRGPDSHPYYVVAEVGVDGELVLYDLFLDGSLWHSSAHVEKEPLVGRFRGRLQAGWGPVSLEFGMTRSTREFKRQRHPHSFGTISLSIRP